MTQKKNTPTAPAKAEKTPAVTEVVDNTEAKVAPKKTASVASEVDIGFGIVQVNYA